MAQTKKQLTYELNVQGLENIKKGMESLGQSGGDLTKYAEKALKYIQDITDISNQFGDKIPLTEVKKIQELYGKILGLGEKIEKLEKIDVFDEDEQKKMSNYLQQIKDINDEIKKLETNSQKTFDKAGSLQKILSQQTTAKNGKNIKLSSLDTAAQSMGKGSKTDLSEDDLKALQKIPDYTEAATAVLERLSVQEQKFKDNLSKVNIELGKKKVQVSEVEKKINSLNSSTRQVNDTEKQFGTTMQHFASEQITKTEQLINNAEKAGQTEVAVTKETDQHSQTVNVATGRVLKYGISYQIVRNILKETIKTITEMDQAITGMTVVTGMSREEAQSYVSTLQEISSATSTAMTDVANLTTEYLRQGRTMQDALELTEQTAKAAKISGLSTADTIQYMTAAINGFNLAAEDSERVSDIFSNLAATSATTYENLAIALSKVSAQANLAGMSIEYTSALLAKGMETTQEAPESIGTALKTVIARMRELDDYGSTLEDGVDVNSVESALKSAGIALRDTTGEFRDLEDVFNELGPKWDSLNAMQQQSIAQAVAGTRQQSRFVAIMQDWERTQELVTEAQDSAGASAAQYAQYEKGMEAALTKLQTAYQSFIQSISSNKIIIGLVNFITDALDKITDILSSGGELTQAIGTIGILLGTVGSVLSKFKGYFDAWIQTNRDLVKTNEEILALNKEKNELNKDETASLKLQEQENNTKLEQLKKQEEEIKKINKEMDSNQKQIDSNGYRKLENEYSNTQAELDDTQNNLGREVEGQDYVDTYNADVEKIEQLKQKLIELKEQMLEYDEEEVNKLRELEDSNTKLTEEKQKQQDIANNINVINTDQLNQQNSIFNLLSEQDKAELDAQLEKNNALLQQLEIEKEIAETKLKAAEGTDEEAEASASLAKINNKIKTLNASNNKLLIKATQSIGSQNKIFTGLANKISKKFGVNIQNIATKYTGMKKTVLDIAQGNKLNNKSVKDALSIEQTKLDAMIKSGVQGEELTKQQETVNKLTQAQNALHGKDKISKEALLALGVSEQTIGQKQLTEEQQKTFEKEKQALIDKGIPAAQATELAMDKTLKIAEQDKTKEKQKGFGAALSNAGATMAQSAAEIPVVGWVIAAAILAAICGIGVAAGISSTTSSAQSSKTSDTIANNQTQAYNLKKDLNTNEGYASDFETLLNKTRTEEEEETFQELTSSMQDLDDDFAGLEGQDLLDAVQAKNNQDRALYNNLINANYDLALTMTDLSDSNEDAKVARNAIESKLIASQEDLIDSNAQLIASNDESLTASVTSKTKEISSNIADNISDIFDEKGLGMDSNFAFADYAKYIGIGAVSGAALGTETMPGFGSAIGGVIGALGGLTTAIFSDINNAKTRKQQLEARETYLTNLNNSIVDFTVTMETTLDENADKVSDGLDTSTFTDSLKVYHDSIKTFTDEFGKQAAAAIDSTYSTFSFINDMLSDDEGTLNNDMLETLDKLMDLQVLTEESIEKLANLMSSIDTTANNISKANSLWNEDGSWQNYYQRLIDHNDNLTENSTAQDVYDEIMSHVQYNDDGSIKYDKNGNVKLKDDGWKNGMTDAHVNEVLQQMSAIIATGYGDYSKSAMEAINKAYSGASDYDFSTNFTTFINTLDDKITSIQNSGSDITNADKVAAIYESAQSSEFYQKVDDLNNQAKDLESYASTLDQDSSEYTQVMKQVNELKNQASEWKATIESTIQEMAGYKDSGTLSDMYTSMMSSLDSINDLKSKIDEGENLEADDIDQIANIADSLVAKNSDLDYSQVFEEIKKGTALGKEYLNQYVENAKAETLDTLDLAMENALYMAEHTTDEDDKRLYQHIAEVAKAYKEMVTEYESGASKLTEHEFAEQSAEAELEILEASKDSETYASMQKQLALVKKLKTLYAEDLEASYGELASKMSATGSTVSADMLKSYIKYENGVVTLTAEGYANLSAEQIEAFENYRETLEDQASAYQDYCDKENELTEDIQQNQIDTENELYEAYCSRLEDETEALKAALDKRKEMYEKYFDSLEDDEDEEDYETERQRLENAIAKLSTSTDATSLQKLADYQKELQDLEDEYNDSVRDDIKEATLASLDNESTLADDNLEEQEENKQTIIDALHTWSNDELVNLLVEANGENQSDAEKAQNTTNAQTTTDNFNAVPANAKGGLVDYTGLAWVDGTYSNPEAFLSADQTALFSSLANSLQQIYNGNTVYNNNQDSSSGSLTVGDITVNIPQGTDLSNFNANDFASLMLDGLQRVGKNYNKR